MKRPQVGIDSVSVLKLNLRVPFVLTLGIHNFQLAHEADRECGISKPVHFAVLKEETV